MKPGSYSRDSDLVSLECSLVIKIFKSSLDHSNMLQSLKNQPQVKARHGGKMTQYLSMGDRKRWQNTIEPATPPANVFSHLLRPAASGSLREPSRERTHSTITANACISIPSGPAVPRSEWAQVSADCVLPAHLKAYLFFLAVLVSYVGEKTDMSIRLGKVCLLYCLSKLLRSTREAKWLLLGMF